MKKNNSKDENKMQDNDGYEFKSRRKLRKKSPLMPISITLGSIIVVLIIAICVGAAMVNGNSVADGVQVGNVDLSDMSVKDAKTALEAFPTDTEYVFTLKCEDKTYTIDTNELPYTLDTEATAQKAFLYGKSGNIFSRAISAVSTKLKPINLLPVFIFEDSDIIERINSFGVQVYGEAKEHSAHISEDQKIVLTPGVTGYDGNSDPAHIAFMQALEENTLKDIEVTFDKKAPDILTVEKLSEMVYSEGLDAAFKIVDGEVIVTEAQAGYSFDEDEAKAALAKLSEGGPEIYLSCKAIQPKHTAEELRKKLFNSELASYSTRYNASQRDRSANIAIAAGKINNVILLPGETFSFNTTVGKRTTANGFKPAPEYQNGQTVTGIGGGTCQVSTTLYSAVLYSNLEIVSRRNHSMTVSYVPLGQDATVTDGGTDLKFKNNTDYPVKIKTSAGKGTVTVKIIGTQAEPPVKIKIVHDNTGELSVKTTRIVYDANGGEISRQTVGTSKYKPHVSTSPSASPTPSASEAPTVTASPAPQQPVSVPQEPSAPVFADQPSAPETETPVQPAPQLPQKGETPAAAPAAPAQQAPAELPSHQVPSGDDAM